MMSNLWGKYKKIQGFMEPFWDLEIEWYVEQLTFVSS